jgi:hypothetical protein
VEDFLVGFAQDQKLTPTFDSGTSLFVSKHPLDRSRLSSGVIILVDAGNLVVGYLDHCTDWDSEDRAILMNSVQDVLLQIASIEYLAPNIAIFERREYRGDGFCQSDVFLSRLLAFVGVVPNDGIWGIDAVDSRYVALFECFGESVGEFVHVARQDGSPAGNE